MLGVRGKDEEEGTGVVFSLFGIFWVLRFWCLRLLSFRFRILRGGVLGLRERFLIDIYRCAYIYGYTYI